MCACMNVCMDLFPSTLRIERRKYKASRKLKDMVSSFMSMFHSIRYKHIDIHITDLCNVFCS